MDKLKPCPFCGKPVNIYYSSATKGYYVVHVDEQHSDCMVLMPLSINHNRILLSLAEAYASWNDRPLVENAPTVDAVKHGKWISVGKSLCSCSVCGDYVDDALYCGYNFCPNCGASMDGKEKDDE